MLFRSQVDYGRAGVPMAPNAWGERETIDQIVWYSILLVALTLLPVCIGMLGLPYLVAASVLGAWFLRDAIRVWRRRDAGDWGAPSWKLYKFSLLYLALLFLAMAVDRHL